MPTPNKDDLRRDMMRSIVMEPLASMVTAQDRVAPMRFDIIIWLNESFRGGIDAAREDVLAQLAPFDPGAASCSQYCFARLSAEQILSVAAETRARIRNGGRDAAAVFQIWNDDEVHLSLTRSLTTVKADAAQRAFHALGEGIVWAVLDSGIDGSHPHFAEFNNTEVSGPLEHTDFTPNGNAPLADEPGHGTHVAGIIAGRWQSAGVMGRETRNEACPNPDLQLEPLPAISGVAPRAKLLSLKVVGPTGGGRVSWVLSAIEHIQQWNQYGKRLLVHGANLSLGYDFDPRWFGCGQSPLCVEVNRLVRSGVSVVVSAGNGGYSSFVTASGATMERFSDLSITTLGMRSLQSRWAPLIARCLIPTACRTSRREGRPGTGG